MNILPAFFINTEPQAVPPDVIETFQQPSKCFGLDLNTFYLVGEIDEKEALIQAIFFMLNTEKENYIVYPDWYGLTLSDLYGKKAEYVASELERRIKEALLADDRILEIKDFQTRITNGELAAYYVINTIYGTIKVDGDDIDV